jgi:GNAT superfamily N-acetyltransferase
MDHAAFAPRRARLDEADAICAVVRAAYAPWVPIIGREPRPMQADYRRAVLDHRFDLIHATDGSILALIETEIRDAHLWIENIAVAPVAQGQGIGHELLAFAERLAADTSRSRLKLLTNGKMAANIGLYRSVGYVIDREEPFGDGTVVYMSKMLP